MIPRVLRPSAGAPPADEAGDLQARLYTSLCLWSGILSAAVVGPFNAVQELPLVVNVGTVCFAVFSFGLYAAARRGRVYPSVLLAGLLAVLNIGWFPNAGSHGSIAFYFFPAMGVPLIFYVGWRRWALVAAIVGNALLLFLLESWFPDLRRPFTDERDRLIDLMANMVVACLVYAIVLRVVINGYHHERRQLKTALAALSESQAVLTTLIDSTDDLAWLVDAEAFRLTAFNTAFAATVRSTFGVEPRKGHALADILPAGHVDEWKAFFARAVRDGPYTVEYAIPDGDQVMLHSFGPVRHDGVVVGVSVFGKDITSRKRAEQQQEREAHQVLESQRLESLGRLAGGVAHDFNNMLGGIMGHADLLLDDEIDGERRQRLQAILNAARRSADLTAKLLAFGRRGRNLVEAVDLNAIVRDAVAMLQPSFARGTRDVEVVEALSATWTVDGDPSQLNQVVVNLCMNAIDAMPGGGRLVLATADVTIDHEAAASMGRAAGDFVRLRVADTGHGMEDAVRARVFEPFFTTKEHNRTSGTGLGLSTVHGIVHLHQGTIAVESAPGAGAAFTVWLPRGHVAALAVPAKGPLPAPGVSAGRLGRILVVDDEPQLRSFMASALRRLGYDSELAVDGEDGLRVFAEHRDSLTGVILDLKMPRKGGREVFVEMHARAPALPVLICSGYGDNEEAQALITLGARGLLPKPFRIDDLAEQLARLR